MKTYTQTELQEILTEHKKWIFDLANGKRADLEGAYLQGAYLKGAYLKVAYLSGAYLKGADLECADLSCADLRGAYLQGAYLSGADLEGAYLSGADLEGAYLSGAYLQGADLEGANLREAKIDYQIEEGLLKKVATAALAGDDTLDMSTWHTCDTTHCIAGWACHLAKGGKKLEERYSPQIAGLLLLGAEAHSHFFDNNEYARAWLQSIKEGTE